MSDDLSSQGFIVIGINVRQYLASFTEGKGHLETRDIAEDFHALGEFLKVGGLLQRPVFLSGVSEGAALAVVAAAYPPNHDWIDGVITMGLPPTAELAWRWADAASWVTGRDPGEPSFVVHDFLGAVSPLPLVMIQSTKDDYVTDADRERFLRSAREPKRLVLIDARNHRFSGRGDELRARYTAGLDWIRAAGATK
jgi:alpha-beta hydrolase superfamily lysophospholipase